LKKRLYNAQRLDGGIVMKNIERVVLVSLALMFIVGTRIAPGHVAEAQQHTATAVTHLYTGADGQSHVEQLTVKFSPVPGAPVPEEESEHAKTATSYLVRLAPGFFQSWHNADKRRYVVTISGKAEIEVAGSQKFILGPGQIALAEDLTGKGHTFRVEGSQDWVALFVDLAN
jgi:hypothetical protein